MPPADRTRGIREAHGAETTVEALGALPDIRGVADLRAAYPSGRIGPQTAVYGLIGPHPEDDRAREYNRAFRAHGIAAVAVSLVVPEDGDAAETIAACRALDVRGYHVHPPHQETVGQALDELDPSACRTGKVNAVYTRGDHLVGAWVETPAEQFGLWTGRDLATGGPKWSATGQSIDR